MVYPTLVDRFCAGVKAVKCQLDLNKTNEILKEIQRRLAEQLVKECLSDTSSIAPTPQLFLNFEKNKSSDPYTLVTVVLPGSSRCPYSLKVTDGSKGLNQVKFFLSFHAVSTSESAQTIEEIFDNACDNVHSLNPLRRFSKGFKNPGPEVL